MTAGTFQPSASYNKGTAEVAPASEDTEETGPFACGGSVEARTWQLWDKQGRDFVVHQQMGARLKIQADTYALYDIQIQFHNLMQMAQRCARVDRLVQLAFDLIPVYDSLELLNGNTSNPAWI